MSEPIAPRLVLLVGAPRSGTTWLQGLLGAHPRIASPQETDLFARYLDPLEAAWAWQMRGQPTDWIARRLKGLPSILRQDQFRALGSDLVARMLDAVIELKPGADVVLEKSPIHALHLETASVYAPDATVMHLIRDGRDVVTSLVAASQGWGADWAPGDIASAAQLWADSVNAARAAATAPGGYVEVRFEELRRATAATLAKLLGAIDIATDLEECERLVDSQSLERAQQGNRRSESILVAGEFAAYADRAEPGGFYGRSDISSWQTLWAPSDRVGFADVAGELLVELGYEPDDAWIGPPGAADRIRRVRKVRIAAARVVNGIARRVADGLAPR